LVWTPDCARSVLREIEAYLRQSLEQSLMPSIYEKAPWLKEQFSLLN
jgi:hypothetical protein